MNAILDFLYLDIARIKSLLSQLNQGLVESVIERSVKSGEAKAGAKIFGLAELRGGLVLEKSIEQEKSLRDYLYTLFEEAAAEAGLLAPVVDLHDHSSWKESRAQIKGGQLLKYTAPTRILNARHFRERIEATIGLAASLAGVVVSKDQANKVPEKQRDQETKAAGEKMLGGKHIVLQMRSMGTFVDDFFNSQIIIRQFPCGMEFADCNLVGILSQEPGVLQDQPDTLFAKYGYGPSEWTVVSQVANIADENQPVEFPSVDPELMKGQEVQRQNLEAFIDSFMGRMQTLGLSAAARFPEISVTPLAVYHSVEYDGQSASL
jgi:hypothetical protein